MLSESQRKAFEGTLQDPTKISALVAQEFEVDPPWWELDASADTLGQGDLGREDSDEAESDNDGISRTRPQLISSEILPPLKSDERGNVMVNPRLVYNIAAVL